MPRSILIIDDSDVTRAALRARLEKSGATVVCASSAKDALDVDALAFHAAIVDVELGSDDGISLANVLAGRHPNMRLALFSAYDREPPPSTRRTFHKPDEIESVVAWALAED